MPIEIAVNIIENPENLPDGCKFLIFGHVFQALSERPLEARASPRIRWGGPDAWGQVDLTAEFEVCLSGWW